MTANDGTQITQAAPDADDDAFAVGAGAVADMAARAAEASAFLRALSHEGRLMILCHLAMGARSVSELEALLGLRQAAVSQQLARLRAEGMVRARREGKSIRYSLGDERVRRAVMLMHEIFCADPGPR